MQGAIAEGEAKTFIYGHSPGRETGLGYARVRSALDPKTDTRQRGTPVKPAPAVPIYSYIRALQRAFSRHY
jgi:hypothetical protein